jgi:hypothetical protein
MNDFVAFLIKVDNIYDLQVEVSLKLTPVKSVTISRPNEIVTYSQFPLKHSCPQKKEPRIPSLVIEVNSSARASHVTYLLQVGHSNRDGGFPCRQLVLWQSTVAELIWNPAVKQIRQRCAGPEILVMSMRT